MTSRRIVTALSVVVALALPGVPALAAGHGHHGADRGDRGHHESVAPLHGHHGDKHTSKGQRGHDLRQLEGTVVTVDGASLTLQPMSSRAMTLTVAISTSTTIVGEKGVTATLARGEQVHITARVDAAGAYTAVLVRIQRDARTETSRSTETPESTHAPEATEVPEATEAPEATEVPEATEATDSHGASTAGTPAANATAVPDDGHEHGHGHGGNHKH